ncbi:hypothetical protein WJX72_008976 [[Myrmecia] bisecta]|uniref:Uncharacterized protein n=1 Tax=[Myrmecia] bisecta TaxID=41462 RepID=A0AAW1PXH7_9CHLO
MTVWAPCHKRVEAQRTELFRNTPPAVQELDAVLPGSTLALLTDLQTLRLSGHRLRGPLSPDLAHLKLLQVLDLSSNMLTGTLPKEWGDPATGGFPLLQTLDLSNNQLRGGLPQDWANLTSLTVLNMSDNANVCCQLVPAVAASRVLILDMTGTKALPCATDGSARPAKAPAASPPAGQPPGATGFQAASFNRSMGVNIAVSVIIGSCLVFGVVAGVVRVRRQQAEHQAWMQRRRRRLEAVRMLGRASGDANGDDLEGVTESSSSGALEPAPALADKDPAEEARAFKPSRWWFGRSPTPPPSHVAVQPNPSRDEHHSASDSPRPAAADARRRATARGAQGLIS